MQFKPSDLSASGLSHSDALYRDRLKDTREASAVSHSSSFSGDSSEIERFPKIQPATGLALSRPFKARPPLDALQILSLQQQIGNQAVMRLLKGRSALSRVGRKGQIIAPPSYSKIQRYVEEPATEEEAKSDQVEDRAAIEQLITDGANSTPQGQDKDGLMLKNSCDWILNPQEGVEKIGVLALSPAPQPMVDKYSKKPENLAEETGGPADNQNSKEKASKLIEYQHHNLSKQLEAKGKSSPSAGEAEAAKTELLQKRSMHRYFFTSGPVFPKGQEEKIEISNHPVNVRGFATQVKGKRAINLFKPALYKAEMVKVIRHEMQHVADRSKESPAEVKNQDDFKKAWQLYQTEYQAYTLENKNKQPAKGYRADSNKPGDILDGDRLKEFVVENNLFLVEGAQNYRWTPRQYWIFDHLYHSGAYLPIRERWNLENALPLKKRYFQQAVSTFRKQQSNNKLNSQRIDNFNQSIAGGAPEIKDAITKYAAIYGQFWSPAAPEKTRLTPDEKEKAQKTPHFEKFFKSEQQKNNWLAGKLSSEEILEPKFVEQQGGFWQTVPEYIAGNTIPLKKFLTAHWSVTVNETDNNSQTVEGEEDYLDLILDSIQQKIESKDINREKYAQLKDEVKNHKEQWLKQKTRSD